MKREGKIKSIFAHVFIVLIIGGLIYGSVVNVSLNKVGAVAYAADDWEDLDDGDLVSAFQAYCKSRNLLVEGSAAYAATTWTTSTFNNICSSLGIDITELQAELKKRTDGNLGTRWLFSVTGINGFNRIAAELLQNNELSVGDENVNKVVYSGEIFTDDNGNKCLVYVINRAGSNGTKLSKSLITQYGTKLKYDGIEIKNDIPLNSYKNYTFVINGESYTGNLTKFYAQSNGLGFNHSDKYSNGNSLGYEFVSQYDRYYCLYDSRYPEKYGHICIFKSSDNKLYIGCIWFNSDGADLNNNYFGYRGIAINTDNESPTDDTNVRIVTPTDKPILPEIPDDAPIEIGDDGDTSGGGDGGDDDDDDWNPTTPTIPDPSSPDFPSVEIPDIDIPDLPSLNFSLGDLSEKFPFSIPFDAIALLTVLDGEPQAPHIQATIPIGTYYTWEFDADFSEFDRYARIFRAFEFIGFCIGLIWLTIHFVKG